jgi:hypothetical protein
LALPASVCYKGARNHQENGDGGFYLVFRPACARLDLPSGHPAASAAVAQREDTLTKPPRSLGRLEELVAWLAHWQGHAPPQLDQVEVLVSPAITA